MFETSAVMHVVRGFVYLYTKKDPSVSAYLGVKLSILLNKDSLLTCTKARWEPRQP